jgi:assimilatory nitrate reductase catalytic subunit
MAPQDMARRFINEGDLVEVSNARGSQIFIANASDSIKTGQSFIAMHWGEEFVSGGKQDHAGLLQTQLGVNALCNPATDPDSKQPELKHAAIKITKLDLPWHFLAMAWVDEDQILRIQQALRGHYADFSYAHCVLFGREGKKQGVIFRAAHPAAVAPDITEAIFQLLHLQGDSALHYGNQRRGTSRQIQLENDPQNLSVRRITGFALAGGLAAEDWFKQLLLEALPAPSSQSLLAQNNAGISTGKNTINAIGAATLKSKVVCTCNNVGEDQIVASLMHISGNDKECLTTLQTTLSCGSSCGSCVPEIRRLIRERKSIAA